MKKKNIGSCTEDTQVCLTLVGNNLMITNTENLAGMQFYHNGCVDLAVLGETFSQFTVAISSSSISFADFTGGGYIGPQTDQLLLTLTPVDGSEITLDCLQQLTTLASDNNQNSLVVNYNEIQPTQVYLTLVGNNLMITNTENLAGMQFYHNGCVDLAVLGETFSQFTVAISSSSISFADFTGGGYIGPQTDQLLLTLTPVDGSEITLDCLQQLTTLASDNNQNSLVVNYNEIQPTQGCIDPLACNFNAAATIDDGSCEYENEAGVCGDPHVLTFGGNRCELPHVVEKYNFLTTENLVINADTVMRGEEAFVNNIYINYNESSFTINLNTLDLVDEANFNFQVNQLGSLTKEFITEDSKFRFMVNSEKNGFLIKSIENLTQENSSGVLMSDDFDECIIKKLY